MASDSRMVFERQGQRDDAAKAPVAMGWTDSCDKTFLAPQGVGISSFGVCEIGGAPIAGYVESFMHEQLAAGSEEVDDAARKLLAYFSSIPERPDVRFFVAGYKTENEQRVQHVYRVLAAQGQCERCNQPGVVGATWAGESDVLARLHQPVVVVNDQGQPTQRLVHHPVSWRSFTLQDAIDYAVYAIQATIDTMRFQPRPKTVGGPIDVLVIKPDRAFWVRRKELHG